MAFKLFRLRDLIFFDVLNLIMYCIIQTEQDFYRKKEDTRTNINKATEVIIKRIIF